MRTLTVHVDTRFSNVIMNVMNGIHSMENAYVYCKRVMLLINGILMHVIVNVLKTKTVLT